MNKILMILALLIASAFNIFSQETYVGAQYQRSNPSVKEINFRFDNETDSVGFNVAHTHNVFKNVGITGEATANFGNDTQQYTFMGGSTLKLGSGNIKPFVRGLAGVAVQRARTGPYTKGYRIDEGFAFAVGGGVDYKIGKISVRLLQADLLRTYTYNDGANTLRLGTGIVF